MPGINTCHKAIELRRPRARSMNDDNPMELSPSSLPSAGNTAKLSRAALQAIGGAIPIAGGVLSAIAGAWSENEQERVNRFFEQWLEMLKDELKEKAETIVEIMARLDLQDEAISSRVESKEYQSLLKKASRDWGASESEKKREYVRNILSNAAASRVSSDDVVRMYLDWLDNYSELHFDVIAAIYNASGITRGQIWEKIGRQRVPESSADADLYKLLIRDLSTGGIIRHTVNRTITATSLQSSRRGQEALEVVRLWFQHSTTMNAMC